ncbi:MAG: hypothetical protein WBM07_11390 [Chitinivibrionales bacterium]
MISLCKLLFMAVFSCLLIGCAAPATTEKFPNQDEYRPFTLPKGTWQASGTISASFYKDSLDVQHNQFNYGGLLNVFTPSYGITDNLEWILMPLPRVIFSMTGNNKNSMDASVNKNLNLALIAGLTNFDYSSNRKKIDISGDIGFHGKKIIQGKFWNEGSIDFGYSKTQYTDSTGIQFNASAYYNLGVQLSEKTSLRIGYGGSNWFGSQWFYDHLNFIINNNFNPFASLEFFADPYLNVYNTRIKVKGVQIGLETAFQW